MRIQQAARYFQIPSLMCPTIMINHRVHLKIIKKTNTTVNDCCLTPSQQYFSYNYFNIFALKKDFLYSPWSEYFTHKTVILVSIVHLIYLSFWNAISPLHIVTPGSHVFFYFVFLIIFKCTRWFIIIVGHINDGIWKYLGYTKNLFLMQIY
jgi:hypothetical protein